MRILTIIIPLFLLLLPLGSTAQCDQGAKTCDHATMVRCLPHGGFTESIDTAGLMPGCTNNAPLNNPNWFALDITSTDIGLRIQPVNCTGTGIRAGLYDGCGTGANALALACDCSTSDIDLFANNLTPGIYYLLLDGCQNNSCQFEFFALNGTVNTPGLGGLSSVQSNASDVCPGQEIHFSIDKIAGATSYNWNFPSDVQVISADCNEATVIWGDASGYVDVQVLNACESVFPPGLQVDVEVIETFLFGEFCTNEPGFPYQGQLLGPGQTDFFYTAANGCDSVLHYVIAMVPSSETTAYFTFCPGEVDSLGGTLIETPGTYQVDYTNSYGCDSSIIWFVEYSTPMEIEIVTLRDVHCGDCNGQVYAEVSGGLPPYNYLWNDGTTIDLLEEMCRGTYSLTVTDAAGCTAEHVFEMVDVAGLLAFPFITEPSCSDACDGRLEMDIECGIPPFDFTWFGYPDSSATISGLCEGLYQARVIDGIGDTVFVEVLLEGPPELAYDYVVADATCNSSGDGSISGLAAGGSGSYGYLWNDPSYNGSSTLQDLQAGTYTVTITDLVGCTFEETIVVGASEEIVVELEGGNLSCGSTVEITSTVSGGLLSYDYLWSTGETTPSILVNQQGIYTLQVMDAQGCFVTEEIFIADGYAIEMSSTFADCDSLGGTASASVINGLNNPLYEWSTGATTASIDSLAPGGYSVTVTDGDNGCQGHRNVMVELDTACFVRISGFVYNDDVNRDCQLDATTAGIPNLIVRLDNGDFVVTDQNGFYEFEVLSGNYTIEVIYNAWQYVGLCDDPLLVDATALGATYTGNNFYLRDAGVNNLVVKVIKQNARPGFTQRVRICLTNYGSEPATGTLTFVHDPVQQFNYSAITPTSYDDASQTFKWDFTNLPPNHTEYYNVFFDIPIPTPLGTVLNMYFKADPTEFDTTPQDNEIICPFVVTGSYDPNDKQVVPSGEGAEGNISRQDSLLSYQIRFQNTGTDTAFTVVLRDTLDPNLDITTLLPGPSSHPYELDIIKGNILEFTFNDIMLPDSFVNEPASNGFVIFDIQMRPDLAYGTTVSNTAAIYFDFNAPIITNTVVNTLKMPVSTREVAESDIPLTLMPNPHRGQGQLRYQLERREQVRIRLFDVKGRLVEVLQDFTEQGPGLHQLPLDIRAKAAGVYFLHLETANGQ
ncbi:MAG: T9SS type A sorting domain-containing protein, partial [Bacteroidota bacterium]